MRLSRAHIAAAVAAVLLLMLQFGIWFGEYGIFAKRAAAEYTQQLQQTNQVTRRENRSLLAEVHDLRHGHQLLEEKAREDLGLVREGETLFLFHDRGHAPR